MQTDTFSLWGGDFVVQNFELRADEISRMLSTAGDGLRLERGFVREMRVHVPWNAIRSQSLRVEIDAVEVVFAAVRGPAPGAAASLADGEALPSTPKAQPGASPQTGAAAEPLDEANDTWLQPLLRSITGNVAVTVNNLVAKMLRNSVAGCVTVGKVDSRPHSLRWEAMFVPVSGPKPMINRVVSVRDITVSLDSTAHLNERSRFVAGILRRKKARGHAQPVALPVLHRVSLEVFVEWPWLPWPGPVNPIPASHIDVHLSPVRVRFSSDQVLLLRDLLRPEDVMRTMAASSLSAGGEHEADSNSDRLSAHGIKRSDLGRCFFFAWQ